MLRILPFFVIVSFLGMPATRAGSADSTDSTASLKADSQRFSDASATGNAAELGRLLDDRVTFVDEDGDVGTKSDLVSGAQPHARGSQTLVQTQWHVRRYGNVAVTAFVDVSTARVQGQTLHARFRSTEVWLAEQGGWRMISSQTIALQDDPPAIALPRATLDSYVGRYTAGTGYDVRVARDGDHLTTSLNGAKPVVLRAEVKDVFFTPGQPRVRRIFLRNASGAITGLVSRHEGHGLVLKRVAVS